jgi:hypothetical protein
MKKSIELKADDPILKQVKFKVYSYKDQRVAKQFLPAPDEPETQEIQVSWGDTLTLKRGDYLVSDANNPGEAWPVEREIFEQSHQETVPGTGYFKKITLVSLVPLTTFTDGDPNQLVTIHSLEGAETVPAGKYHLARGIKGEIWAYPNEKIETNLDEVDY